jgi:ribonucleoside-diphosphate reductase alpha chain
LWDRKKEYDYWAAFNDEYTGRNDWYRTISVEFPEQAERMIKYGRRNSNFSTVAPTGSGSIIAQVSSGLEPVFLPFYKRRVSYYTDDLPVIEIEGRKFNEVITVHPKLKEYYKIASNSSISLNSLTLEEWQKIYEQSPYYRQTANEIPIETRIRTQAIIQNYTSNSISSTCNLPSTATVEDINRAYRMGEELGLKGMTVFVDQSKGSVLTSINQDNQINQNESQFRQYNAPKRPKELDAELYISVYRGEEYAVIIGLLEEKPYEVFVCRFPFNIADKHIKGKLVKVQKGRFDFISDFVNIKDINQHLNNDHVRMVSLYTSMLLRHGADIKFICKTAKKVDENIISWVSVMNRILTKYDKNTDGGLCPECGEKMRKEGGCKKCNCGYSICALLYSHKNNQKPPIKNQ